MSTHDEPSSSTEPSGPSASPPSGSPRIAYLYSRYPVVSQTFCDSEMLELEARGVHLTIGSLNPPSDTFRHERHRTFAAETVYPPQPSILKALESRSRASAEWATRLAPMIERHEAAYGTKFKPAVRARNALYFAQEFQRRGIEHVHVHFANQATYTALFIKQLIGLPFSFTAHAQDFMVDLGNDDLLNEMCEEAEFVIAVSDWSRNLLAKTCPDAEEKIHRVYNGIEPEDFPESLPRREGEPFRMVSVGRLIEFKGFHYLLEACAMLKERGVAFECTIIGEGPWKEQLIEQREKLGLTETEICFAGIQTQEQVKDHLKRSQAFVLPCIVDNKGASDILPTVIMEAMAVSLPVISTDIVGVPEMVNGGETGILVPAAKAEPLADALQSIADDPEKGREMGRAGHQLCVERFHRVETTGQLLTKYQALPNGKTSALTWTEPEVLYVVDNWPDESSEENDSMLDRELHYIQRERPEFMILSCSAPGKVDFAQAKTEEQDLLTAMQFLPDAMVLEANWRHHSDDVETMVKLRRQLTTTIDTERYFLEARRALEIATIVKKRGIRRIHAARSNAALTCWLAYQLCPKVKHFSFAIEPQPFLHKKIVEVIAKDADIVSRADHEDELVLNPPAWRHVSIGSAKLRTGREAPPDRGEVLQQWTERLRVSG